MAPHSPTVKLPSRATPSSSAEAMGAHRCSHAIAKAAAPPRKIRIVHVLAPAVIKTDVRHFRELVQRLTGKPDGCVGGGGAASSSTSESAAAESSQPGSSSDAASGEAGAGATEGRAAAAWTTIKAEVEEEGASPEGLVRALAEGEEGMNNVFFRGLEDFLFSSCHMDGFSF